MNQKDILRIIDANLNRLREALRVCEEITRFILEERRYTENLKRIRHEVTKTVSESKKLKYASLVEARDSKNDIGNFTISGELRREDPYSVMKANMQRAKESVRVLEEFFKLIDKKTALRFKDIRFKIYSAEKVLIEKAESTANTR